MGHFVFVVASQSGVAKSLYDEAAIMDFREAWQAMMCATNLRMSIAGAGNGLEFVKSLEG